jgi:hypothetical protein
MPVRSVPINLPEREELPETIAINDVAHRLGVSPETIRRGIRSDMADGGRRIPGGRAIGSRYFVVRAVFERAMRGGIEPEVTNQHVAPDVLDLAARLRQRAAEDLELADRFAELALKTKGRR